MELMIAGAKVRMDKDGHFSLNDLHKAAGGEKRHGPSYWMANEQTRALIAELQTTGIPVVNLAQGRNGGTWVCKELVYAYAMWIDAAFNIRVIRAFDALVEGRLEDAQRIASRQQARLEAPFLTDEACAATKKEHDAYKAAKRAEYNAKRRLETAIRGAA